MLLRFTVRNYRGFKEPVTLSLDKPRDYSFNREYISQGVITNALVLGKNASGKTNLLRAIADVRSNYYPPSTMYAPSEFDECFLNADSGENLAQFEYEFLINGTRVTYAYAKRADRLLSHERLLFDGNVVFEYDSSEGLVEENLGEANAGGLNWTFSGDYQSALAYVSSNAPIQDGSTLDKLRRFTSRISMALHDGWGSSKNVVRYLADILRTEHLGKLETFLNSFGIEDRLAVREDADGSRAIYSVHKRSVPFARCMSSGTRTLVTLFYLYEVLPAGTLYLLDEFDAYCHFEVAERLVRYFGSASGVQTILTTHNTSLTRNDVMRPDCVFLFGNDGSLRALPERTDRELRFGNNVERLLRNGEFE